MLLVHIAGWADIGLKSPHDNTSNDVQLRIDELGECKTASSAARRLFKLKFETNPLSDTTNNVAHTRSPLYKELEASSKLATDKENKELLEVLIVGVESGKTPTAELARSLVTALNVASPNAPTMAGTDRILIREACILPSLKHSPEGTDKLKREIGSHNGHVLMALAGGATTILAEVAGVVAATHQDKWSLVIANRNEKSSADEDASLVDMSVHADPLRGWLMGLGLPAVLDQVSDNPDDEVKTAAESARRAMGESQTPPTPDDFAQVVLADVARGDLAAGMAIRSWIVAEYRRRLDDYNDSRGTDIPDVTMDKKMKPTTLGSAIREAGKASDPPSKWLSEQSDLNNLGIEATHRFGTPGSAGIDTVRKKLGEPPSWLSWPSGQICLLTAQGSRGKDDRPPIIASLLSSAPDEALRRACSIPDSEHLTAHALIACSSSSLDEGCEVAKQVQQKGRFDRDEAWNPIACDTPRDYGDSVTKPGVSASKVESTLAEVFHTTTEWLEEREPRPRAIIVTVLGEKPIVFTLLRAAQDFGAKHGVPVFLMSSVKNEEGKDSLQFHQLGLNRDVRQALLKAAKYCLDRFDLLSSSRLLALGDPAMNQLSDKAAKLADELVEAVNANVLDDHASTVLGAMAAAADLIDGLAPDAKARLVTIIAELVDISKERRKAPGFVAPIILACNTDDSGANDIEKEDPERLLGLLKRIRNKLPINHGSQSLADITPLVLKNYRQRNTTSYSDLLRRAISKVESRHGVSAGDWRTRLQCLRERVEASESADYGEQP